MKILSRNVGKKYVSMKGKFKLNWKRSADIQKQFFINFWKNTETKAKILTVRNDTCQMWAKIDIDIIMKLNVSKHCCKIFLSSGQFT